MKTQLHDAHVQAWEAYWDRFDRIEAALDAHWDRITSCGYEGPDYEDDYTWINLPRVDLEPFVRELVF